MKRPSETLTAAIASIVAAAVAILAGYGVDIKPAVAAGAIVLVGYIAAAVTWYVSRKQSAGKAISGPQGQVSK